jgi:hypothetical protein
MINKIMRSMRDTGLLDGMSDEDVDTIATAALEALRIPNLAMENAAYKHDDSGSQLSCAYDEIYTVMIDAALNE